MLNEKQIKNNIKWLVTNGSPAVKYLTSINLLNKNSHLKSIKKLFSEVKKSNIVKEIFSKQNSDGSWCASGPWALKVPLRKSGYTPISPKYVTTSWILPILGDMGFSISDKRIKKACDYILSYQFKNGYIAESYAKKYNVECSKLDVEPCRFSITLIALGKVKAYEQLKLEKSYNLLIKWQRNDGGWGSSSHIKRMNWTRSCPFATYHAAMALYCSNNHLYKNSLLKAFRFLIDHLSRKKHEEIQRFFYHGHSIIHELLMFSEYNIGLNEKFFQVMLKWLKTMYYSDKNYFHYSGKTISKFNYKNDYMDARVAKYRLFHLIDDDWLTYYITKIMENVLKYK